MSELRVSGVYADYRGRRYRLLSGGDDWMTLSTSPTEDIPDALERGEYRSGTPYAATWAKVPVSALDGVYDVEVTGVIAGHRVSLRNQLADGRIRVWYIGDPAVADEIGLQGDRHDGWTGMFDPAEFSDITVQETRRA